MKLRVIQEYYLEIDREWYDPSILSGDGTIDEQIVEYEKERLIKENIFQGTGFLPGPITVEITEEAVPEIVSGDTHLRDVEIKIIELPDPDQTENRHDTDV